MDRIMEADMSIFSKALHIKKGSTEETANIYSEASEAGDKSLCVKVDGATGYVALGSETDEQATKGRVKISGTVYAIKRTAGTPGRKEYRTPGTYIFTVPDGVNLFTITGSGGGGGGGGAAYAESEVVSAFAAGGKGGAGQKNTTGPHIQLAGKTVVVTVGRGGGYGALRTTTSGSINGDKGADGTPSSVKWSSSSDSDSVTFLGGKGGKGGYAYAVEEESDQKDGAAGSGFDGFGFYEGSAGGAGGNEESPNGEDGQDGWVIIEWGV